LREPTVLMAQLLDYVFGTDRIRRGIGLAIADWHQQRLPCRAISPGSKISD
jgi:hypothetical protein